MKSAEFLDWILNPSDHVKLDKSDQALLTYAEVLTREPVACKQEHVAALRAVGFDDRGILDAAQVVSYFNFVNRMAEGLGVELEDEAGD